MVFERRLIYATTFIIDASSTNERRRYCVFPSSVRPLTHMTRYLFTQCRDFNETYHKYASCDWELLERCSRSEVKGQGHMCINV